ncbi:uncharacterized protein LOC128139577 isoform X1 [Harpia harpyja]|uniref:uncharacterized protein LOC128139577 isoform X1 n=1 Tax=Harpia harpyja TaxID=202280 RepID=UPI0022B144E9|nr:uncharacterized protein LOC128139577 isoform X1 [Harpia harpyja]
MLPVPGFSCISILLPRRPSRSVSVPLPLPLRAASFPLSLLLLSPSPSASLSPSFSLGPAPCFLATPPLSSQLPLFSSLLVSCSSFLAAFASARQPIAPGASRPTVRSPTDRRAWLWDRLPRYPRGRGSVGGAPSPGADSLAGLVRGHAVGAVVRSSPGDAVDCSSLRLAWAVSAWPPSPRGAGAQRDRRSAYWLWAGAAEAGEATERWRMAKRLEFQKRKGGEKEKETSELGKASGSAESKSCGGCQLPPFHCGCPFFCRESTRQMERFRSGLQVQGFPRKHQQPCN